VGPLRRGLKATAQPIQPCCPHVTKPFGTWPGKTAQKDAPTAVHLAKSVNPN